MFLVQLSFVNITSIPDSRCNWYFSYSVFIFSCANFSSSCCFYNCKISICSLCSFLASAFAEVSDDIFAFKRVSDSDVVRTGLLRDITFLSSTSAFIGDLRGNVGFITDAEVDKRQEVEGAWEVCSGGWRRIADRSFQHGRVVLRPIRVAVLFIFINKL